MYLADARSIDTIPQSANADSSLYQREPNDIVRSGRALILSEAFEEVREDGAAFLFENAALVFRVEGEGQLEDIRDRADTAVLGVVCAEIDLRDARVDDRARAHGTRLEGDVQLTLPEPPAA